MIKRLIFIVCICLGGVSLYAAPPVVRASFTPDSVLLGDRFTFRVEVSKDLMQVVEFPAFENGRIESLEIVQEGPIDTVKKEGRMITLAREYTLTCFEPSIYHLCNFPLLVVDKNSVDTLSAIDTLTLVVNTFDIDTTKQQIADIKPPLDTPFRPGEISGYVGLGLAILALIGGVLFLWLRYRKQGSGLLKGRMDPPHVVAIRALEQLHAQKLWQSDRTKLYYTTLTDILRQYMEDRYGFSAMESTTGEILERLKSESLPAGTARRLADLLSVSDYVKFAKFQPESTLNESNYQDAYYFIEETKPTQEEEALGDDTVEVLESDIAPERKEGKA